MKRTLALIWLAACGACPATASFAASTESIMLAPGIYTTADISRRCQTYTNDRVRSTMVDTGRQSVFLACVQRLSRDGHVGPPAVARNTSRLVEAPVSLSTDGYAPDGYGCSTDEGYGRRGRCDNF